MGDVVGVLKIVRPLDREIESTQRGLRGAFVLMGATAGREWTYRRRVNG